MNPFLTECDGFLVENVPEIQNKYRFEIADVVVKPNHQSYIVVANPTEKDINIYPGTQMAKARPVKASSGNVCEEILMNRSLSDRKLAHTGVIRKVWAEEDFQ